MARPQRPHKCSWDDKLIQGLYRCPDGRWRINATGQKFTEPDERRAVAKFLAMQAPPADVHLPVETELATIGPAVRAAAKPEIIITFPKDHTSKVTVSRAVPEAILGPWLREQFLNNVQYLVKLTGLPELASIRHMPLPRASIRASAIVAHYEAENASTETAKRACVRHFNRFIEHTAAKTLEDLSKDKIHAFRQHIEQSPELKSAGTKAWMYGQIKSIISFGLKNPLMDAGEIRACLDRCKLLWTADAPPSHQPRPISRADFHTLLTAAGETSWRAWLLMGLNCAMYIDELCKLEWTAIDLDKGTLAMIRNKTKRERIPKVAVLWPETVAALRALPHKPTFVFTSPHGTRYASPAFQPTVNPAAPKPSTATIQRRTVIRSSNQPSMFVILFLSFGHNRPCGLKRKGAGTSGGYTRDKSPCGKGWATRSGGKDHGSTGQRRRARTRAIGRRVGWIQLDSVLD